VLFPTVTFAVFFMIVLPVSWALMRYQRAWRIWILLASYVFYAWWDWRFVFLLLASTIVNHVLAVAIHRSQRRRACSRASHLDRERAALTMRVPRRKSAALPFTVALPKFADGRR